MPGGSVYIMASRRNGTLYTGVAGNVISRVMAHREGRGSQFAFKYKVFTLVYCEWHDLYTSAIQRETSIKRWKRAWKIALIEKHNPNWEDLMPPPPDVAGFLARLEADQRGRPLAE